MTTKTQSTFLLFRKQWAMLPLAVAIMFVHGCAVQESNQDALLAKARQAEADLNQAITRNQLEVGATREFAPRCANISCLQNDGDIAELINGDAALIALNDGAMRTHKAKESVVSAIKRQDEVFAANKDLFDALGVPIPGTLSSEAVDYQSILTDGSGCKEVVAEFKDGNDYYGRVVGRSVADAGVLISQVAGICVKLRGDHTCRRTKADPTCLYLTGIGQCEVKPIRSVPLEVCDGNSRSAIYILNPGDPVPPDSGALVEAVLVTVDAPPPETQQTSKEWYRQASVKDLDAVKNNGPLVKIQEQFDKSAGDALNEVKKASEAAEEFIKEAPGNGRAILDDLGDKIKATPLGDVLNRGLRGKGNVEHSFQCKSQYHDAVLKLANKWLKKGMSLEKNEFGSPASRRDKEEYLLRLIADDRMRAESRLYTELYDALVDVGAPVISAKDTDYIPAVPLIATALNFSGWKRPLVRAFWFHKRGNEIAEKISSSEFNDRNDKNRDSYNHVYSDIIAVIDYADFSDVYNIRFNTKDENASIVQRTCPAKPGFANRSLKIFDDDKSYVQSIRKAFVNHHR